MYCLCTCQKYSCEPSFERLPDGAPGRQIQVWLARIFRINESSELRLLPEICRVEMNSRIQATEDCGLEAERANRQLCSLS